MMEIWSWAILEHFVLQENIEQVLCWNYVRGPSWHLYVQVLLSSSLWEHLLKFVHEGFVLNLEVIDHLVLVFNMSLKFPDLVLVAVYLVFLDVSEFFNFSLASTFLTFSLTLDQGNVFLLFGLPSSKVFLGFSSEVFLSVLKVSNLFIASLDLKFLDSDSFPQLRDERVLFSILIFKTLDFTFKLVDLQIIDLLDIIKFLNKNKFTEPALLDSLSSSSWTLATLSFKVWTSASRVFLVL